MSNVPKSGSYERYTDPALILRVLNETRNIAVVGLSPKVTRPSHGVALYLKNAGFNIIPINPKVDEIMGEIAYPDLNSAAVEHKIDMVDVFRRPEDCLPIAQDAVEIGAKSIWFQLGVINQEAAMLAEDSGLDVVMDRCVKVEHYRYADRLTKESME
ncbi:MAG: CoA-binding protein [Chloroflexota bacterium]